MYPLKLHKKINVLFVGLEGSGKSFTIQSIAGRCAEEISPNVSRRVVKDGGFYVELTEAHENIEDFFVETHGVVFCLDRTRKTEEANNLLKSVLTHPNMDKKPVLVMTTKVKLEMEVSQELDNIFHHQPQKKVENDRITAKDQNCEFNKWLKTVKKKFSKLNKRVEDDITQRHIIRRQNNKKTDHFIYKSTTTSTQTKTSIGKNTVEALHPEGCCLEISRIPSASNSVQTILSISKNAVEALHPNARYLEISRIASASSSTQTIMSIDKNAVEALDLQPESIYPAKLRTPTRSIGTQTIVSIDKNCVALHPEARYLDKPRTQSACFSTQTIVQIAKKTVEAPGHPENDCPDKSRTSASKGTSINMRKDGTITKVPHAILPTDFRSSSPPSTPVVNLYAKNTLLQIDANHTSSVGSSINLGKDKTLRAVPAALLPSIRRSSAPGKDETAFKQNEAAFQFDEAKPASNNNFKLFKSVKKFMKIMKVKKFSRNGV